MSQQNNYLYQRTPGYSWWVLTSATLNFMCVFIGMNTTSVFGAQIMEQWNINEAQLSLISLVYMIPFAATPVIASSFANKLGVKTIVSIGMICNIVGAVLLGFWGTSFSHLLIIRFIMGCCGGIMDNTMVQNASLYFPNRQRGFATGILMGFLGIGFTVTSILGTWLYETFNMTWQVASMWITLVPSVICYIIYMVSVKDFYKKYPGAETMDDLLPPDPTRVETKYDLLPKPDSSAECLRDKRCWASSIFGFCTAVPVYGLAFALPLYLQDAKGMSLAAASAVIGATFVFKLVAAPIGGIMSDKIFKGVRWQTNVIGHGIGGILIIIVGLATFHDGFLTLMLILMFTGVSLYGGTFWTWPTALAKPNGQYFASGMIVTISNIGAVIIAPICGLLIGAAGNTSISIIFIGIVAILGTIPAYLSKI